MKSVAKENLLQIKDLIDNITELNYNAKLEILSNASIGQHVRHILEFYSLLVSGSFLGSISYDKRERDIRIENSIEFAKQTIDRLLIGIDKLDTNLSVNIEADYTKDGHSQSIINSSVGRELAYCIEHSIHHQALIKAGLIALGLGSIANEHFGVAYSTIRYRKDQCAQLPTYQK